MSVPATLNGKPVIASENHTNCSTVLVQSDGEWIVATYWPELTDHWQWGHYYHGSDAEAQARKDFAMTANRNSHR